jgi:hypothetical protein
MEFYRPPSTRLIFAMQKDNNNNDDNDDMISSDSIIKSTCNWNMAMDPYQCLEQQQNATVKTA